jgi:drug/metabolite transporter (DMT)-like permease
MAAGALFFSLMSLLVRIVGQGMPTMEVVLGRSVVVLAIAWILLRRKGVSLWGVERRLLFLRGVLGFISLSCFYYALIHLPLADATVIQYTNPVWTALLASVVLAERAGRREVSLSLASLGGVILMSRPTLLFGGAAPALPPLPVIVAVIGALFSAGAYVSVRILGRSEEPVVVVFWFSLVSTVGALPFVVPRFTFPSGPELVLLAAVGATTYAGQVLITMGLREERAGRAMAVAYLQIVFAAIWGIALLNEIPDRWTVGGAGVILACTWALGRIRVPGM